VSIEVRKAELARLLRRSAIGLELNEHINDEDAARVFEHACRLGFEGIVSKRRGSTYQSGRILRLVETEEPECASRPPRGADWQSRIGAPRLPETLRDRLYVVESPRPGVAIGRQRPKRKR
jgi:hypothetical protein